MIKAVIARWFVCFGLLYLAVAASAAYGVTTLDDRNYRLKASIGGISYDGEKVSGTKVEIQIGAWVEAMTTPAGEPPPQYAGSPWTHWLIKNPRLKIGGFTIFPLKAPSTNYNEEPYSCGVRFATSKFAHGTDLPIEFKVVIQPFRGVLDGPLFTNFETGPERELTVLVQPQVYNTALLLATRERAKMDGSFVLDDPAEVKGYADASQAAMIPAAASVSVMNHANITTKSPEQMMESDLAPLLKMATVAFFFTHGTDFSMRSSLDDDMLFRPYNGLSNEIAPYVKASRNVPQLKGVVNNQVVDAPGLNIVLVHGCWTWVNQNVNIAFGLTHTMTDLYENRSYAGFDGLTHSLLTDQTTMLSEHARYVYEKMGQGLTIYKAVHQANQLYPPRKLNLSGNLVPAPMLMRGDIYARLIGVYEAGKHEAQPWFKVLS